VTDREAILAEVVRLTGREIMQPDDILSTDLADRLGVTEVTARRDLNQLVKDGLATTACVYDPGRGRRVRVWRLNNAPRGGSPPE